MKNDIVYTVLLRSGFAIPNLPVLAKYRKGSFSVKIQKYLLCKKNNLSVVRFHAYGNELWVMTERQDHGYRWLKLVSSAGWWLELG